jgi:hypothetical protein
MPSRLCRPTRWGGDQTGLVVMLPTTTSSAAQPGAEHAEQPMPSDPACGHQRRLHYQQHDPARHDDGMDMQ